MTIALQGYTFTKNFGDLLLLEIAKQFVSEISPEPIAIPNVPQHLRADFFVGDSYGMPSLASSRALILYGGGYLGAPAEADPSWNKLALERYGEVIRVALERQIPLAIFGVGFGPVPPGGFQDLLRAALDQARLVVVRDDASRDEVLKLSDRANPLVLPDLAFAMPSLAPRLGEGPRVPGLGLHLTGKYATREYFNAFGNLLRASDYSSRVTLIRDDIKIFTPLHAIRHFFGDPRVDRNWKTGLAFLNSWQGPVDQIRFDSTRTFIEALNGPELVVTSKLHVAVLRLAYGRPVISMPVHDKVRRMFSYLGTSDCVLEPDMLGRLRYDDLMERAKRALRSENLQRARQEAMGSRQLLQKFLTAG
jgi:polysaccharide pyruvyl transferase WcaK-like protein